MKTAEQIARGSIGQESDRLAKEAVRLFQAGYGTWEEIIAFQIVKYGEAVRQKAADTVRPRTKRPCDCETCDCGNWAASAIERMELP